MYMMKRRSFQLTLARLCKEQIKEREKERNLLCSPVNICWSVPSVILYICGSTHANYVPERGTFCWEPLGIKKKKPSLHQWWELPPVQALTLLPNHFAQCENGDSSSRLGPPWGAFRVESELQLPDQRRQKNTIMCQTGREGFVI